MEDGGSARGSPWIRGGATAPLRQKVIAVKPESSIQFRNVLTELALRRRSRPRPEPVLAELEALLSERLQVRWVSLFNNPTRALMCALQALEVQGEVVTTPCAGLATGHALHWMGLRPVFADIEPDSLNLDPERVEAAITPGTTAILANHCLGRPCDVQAMERLAERYGLRVLYNAAQAFGPGFGVLRRGELSVVGFRAAGLFGALDGAAVLCRDAAMKRRLDELSAEAGSGLQPMARMAGPRRNMDALTAATCLQRLRGMAGNTARRARLESRYRERLGALPGLHCLPPASGRPGGRACFPVLVDGGYPLGRDGLYQRLRARGVDARRGFQPLLSELSLFRQLPSAGAGRLPVATAVARRLLCLPLDPELEGQPFEALVGIVERGAAPCARVSSV